MCGGACVCWFSRTQKCVTLSTSEAEYVGMAFHATRLGDVVLSIFSGQSGRGTTLAKPGIELKFEAH